MVFQSKKSDDDDDSYLKLLQRISNDIVQPLNLLNSFKLTVAEPVPVGGKVLIKRFLAYTQLSFDALLYTLGKESDIYTQKGDIKGMRDAFRYTPGLPSATFKAYDFYKHKKNDFQDIIMNSGIR